MEESCIQKDSVCLLRSTDIYPYILTTPAVRAVSEVSTNDNLSPAPPTMLKFNICALKHYCNKDCEVSEYQQTEIN